MLWCQAKWQYEHHCKGVADNMRISTSEDAYAHTGVASAQGAVNINVTGMLIGMLKTHYHKAAHTRHAHRGRTPPWRGRGVGAELEVMLSARSSWLV